MRNKILIFIGLFFISTVALAQGQWNRRASTQLHKTLELEFLIATGAMPGVSRVNVFGANSDIDTGGGLPEDLWDGGGVYTGFPTGAAELVEVLSSSADDDDGGSGCEVVTITGLSADGEVQSEDITLNGTAAVDSTNTYDRVWDVMCKESANGANSAFNAGTITARHTTTTANTFAVMPAGTNRSRVCAYTIPAGKTGYLRDWAVLVSQSLTANIQGALWVREDGAPPKLIRNYSSANVDAHKDHIYGYLELPALTDITVRATATSVDNVDAECFMDIILVDNAS